MGLKFFEDVVTGEAPVFGNYEITKDEIIDFAKQFDPQPFHLDEDAAKKSLLGGLSASGWQTAAISMRLLYESFLVNAASMGSPGVDELKWLKPVRPGDRLSLRTNVLEKRESHSRPDLGIVLMQSDMLNQNGEVVMFHRAPLMLRRRGASQDQPAPGRSAPKAEPRSETQVEPAGASTAASAAIERPNQALYFEDLVIGQSSRFGPHTFDKAAIIAFAKKYDPQPFHIDEEAAKKSHFGGLVASGWHTAAAYMRHLIAYRKKVLADILANGAVLPEPGPSPGFSNMRWRAPVYAGDTLRFTSELASKRKVSRPGWGLVFFQNRGFNQDDRLVFEFQAVAFWQMRP